MADWAPLAIMEPISSGLSFAAEQVQEFLARTVMRENGSMTSPAVSLKERPGRFGEHLFRI